MVQKDILIINPKSNISVATLWTQKEIILSKLSEDIKNKINVIGTLYTFPGVNYILETLDQNPQINRIIVYGLDASSSGQALIEIFNKKDEETLRKYNIQFKLNDILDILNTVEIIDLRKQFLINKLNNLNELEKVINENYDTGKKYRQTKGLKVIEKVDEIESWPEIIAPIVIYESSVFNAWVKVIDSVFKYGQIVETEYNEKSKQIMNVITTIKLNGEEYKIEKEFFDFIPEKDFEAHIKSLNLKSSSKEVGVEYNYGERLRNYHGIDQVENMVKRLIKDKNTRRAFSTLWDPSVDTDSSYPPCITSVQGLIQNDYYYHTVYIRSNDMFRGWPLNMVGQIKLAEEIVKRYNERTGENIKLGYVTTISVAAHIYEHDFKYALELLNKYSYRIYNFVQDLRGNFLIYIKDNKVCLEQKTPNNLYTYFLECYNLNEEKKAYNTLKRFSYNLSPDHAMYLGWELAKAFEYLRTGKEFKQDKV
ncbi:thymidylate synthase [Nanoarchaeota archaeon]